MVKLEGNLSISLVTLTFSLNISSSSGRDAGLRALSMDWAIVWYHADANSSCDLNFNASVNRSSSWHLTSSILSPYIPFNVFTVLRMIAFMLSFKPYLSPASTLIVSHSKARCYRENIYSMPIFEASRPCQLSHLLHQAFSNLIHIGCITVS